MLDLEHWPVERLIEYARNPRKNDHAVDRVAAAIKEFGFRVPIVAKSDGLVVDGHLRLKAAKKLGLAEVPVVLADDMTEAQIKAFRLSVNKISELADWDMDLLSIELGELGELDFNLSLTGFGEDELATLLADKTEGMTDPDDVPDVQEQAITVPGDTWLLGKHRLRCGDSTSVTEIDALMNGERAVQRVNGTYQSANGWFDTSKEHGVDIGKKTHGAGMAVSMPVRMLEIHCRPGHIVYEPFCGTGTTVVAGEMTGRRVFAGEVSPQYTDLTVRRWQEFTGRAATLESDGRSFADIEGERQKAAA